MKKLFLLPILVSAVASPALAMEKKLKAESENVALSNEVVPMVVSTDECLICTTVAGDMEDEEIYLTSCCKKLLCHNCYVQNMKIGVQKELCPQRCNANKPDQKFELVKASCEFIPSFPFEALPGNVLILTLKKLAQTDSNCLDQSTIDSYKGINALSRANSYLHNFINDPNTIEEIMKFFYGHPVYALSLGLPGAITWVNKGNFEYDCGKILLTKMEWLTTQAVFAHAEAIKKLAKCSIESSLKVAKLKIIGDANPMALKRLIADSIKIPELIHILKRMLMHPDCTFSDLSLAIMLEEAIRVGEQSIVYLLFRKPNLEINKGLAVREDSLISDLFPLHWRFYFSEHHDTPLMNAIRQNKKDVIYLLLMHPSIDITKQVNGKTALDIAKEVGNPEIVEILQFSQNK